MENRELDEFGRPPDEIKRYADDEGLKNELGPKYAEYK